MAVQPNIDRLKSALMTSGLSQKDPALYQVINGLIDYIRQNTMATNEMIVASSSSGSGGGLALAIDELTGDVVAVGPGVVPATIQPKVINYGKIQDTILANVLLGRATTPGEIEELLLGAGLSIIGGELVVTNPYPGFTGLHNLLSSVHPDTLPASPIEGDLIYAGPGVTPAGTYINHVIMASVVEDFVGIRAGYMLNAGGLFPPLCAAYGVPIIAMKVPEIPDNMPTPDIWDGFIQASIVEDFTGIRAGYNGLVPGGTEPGAGKYGAYSVPFMAMVVPPSPNPTETLGTWKRFPAGVNDDVLTMEAGIPSWKSLVIPVASYPWIDIPFDASDFTATGGTTPDWIVASGDVKRWQYQLLPGNNVRIVLYVIQTTVSGSGPTRLIVELPFNIAGQFGQFISLRENDLIVVDTGVGYDDSLATNQIYIEKVPFGGVFDTTAGKTWLSFEISAVLG